MRINILILCFSDSCIKMIGCAGMSVITVTLRDFLWLGCLVVSVALAFGRLRLDIRHLEDIKADRDEMVRLSNDIYAILSEIRSTLARLEESVRLHKLQFEDDAGG